jgi:DNA-binding transcriptional LysR family regulator
MDKKLIDLKSLKVFVTFCDYLNLSKTAEVLHLTQPAISHHIGSLEKHLKTPLVDREIRPMALTQAGKLLKQRGLQHLAELNTTVQLLLNKKVGFMAAFKIGISELLADMTLEAIGGQLLSFAENLTIESSKSSTLFEKLLNRDLDMIITSKSGENYPELESKLIYKEPIVGICHNSLKRRMKKNQELDFLITEQVGYVEFLPSLTLGLAMKQYFYRMNKQPANKVKIDSAKNAMTLVNSLPVWSVGIPLLMRRLKADFKKIHIFNLPEPVVESSWHLIYRRHEYVKPAEIIEKILKRFMMNL